MDRPMPESLTRETAPNKAWSRRLQRPLRSRFRQRLSASVIAPRKAWRLLQGESPCRVRASHPPVSSLASMAESWVTTANKMGEA